MLGYPLDIKGQDIHAYIMLKTEHESSEKLRRELLRIVGEQIGLFAAPDMIQSPPEGLG